ncbi:hypothetical protein SAMN05216304_11161 [Bosea sp. OK403]|nr:hypothetical protein SAMN05216304_11161 [Bosea sp. OK403]
MVTRRPSPVIPGHAEGMSPEPTTGYARHDAFGSPNPVVGSGFGPAGRPGMTEGAAAPC